MKNTNPLTRKNVFYDKHYEKFQLYENAKEYLTAVMNGKTAVPIKDWQAQQKKLIAERFSLCEDYYKLKDEVRSVEILRRGVDNIMREQIKVQRTHEVEL